MPPVGDHWSPSCAHATEFPRGWGEGRSCPFYVGQVVEIADTARKVKIFEDVPPSHPLSNMVVSSLLFGRDGTQIQFTIAAAAGVLLGLAGGALRVWCYNELGKDFTFEMTIKKNHRLVTTGPYSVVRHPSYTGFLMTASAVALLHGTRGSWLRESGLLSSTFSLMMRMTDEDEGLRRRFGDEWNAWAEGVRYLVIPGLV